MSKEKLRELEEEIRIFFENYDRVNADREVSAEEIAFDPQLRYYRDLRNMIDTARQDGMLKGIRESVKEQGFDLNTLEGKQEVARHLLLRDSDVDLIVRVTGLTNQQIEQLRDQKGLGGGEQQKVIEIARNLLDVLDDNTIALKTGLSLDQVMTLRGKIR